MRRCTTVTVYEVFNSKPVQWNIEALNTDGDGGIDLTIFSGPDAEQRAREYAKLNYQE